MTVFQLLGLVASIVTLLGAFAWSIPMTPPIGEPWICLGQIRILYPGEVASAHVTEAQLLAALAAGQTSVQIEEYIVEPGRGFDMWWLRFSYRLFGRYLHRGQPQITAGTSMERERL